MVECLPCLYEAIGLVTTTVKKKFIYRTWKIVSYNLKCILSTHSHFPPRSSSAVTLLCLLLGPCSLLVLLLMFCFPPTKKRLLNLVFLSFQSSSGHLPFYSEDSFGALILSVNDWVSFHAWWF